MWQSVHRDSIISNKQISSTLYFALSLSSLLSPLSFLLSPFSPLPPFGRFFLFRSFRFVNGSTHQIIVSVWLRSFRNEICFGILYHTLPKIHLRDNFTIHSMRDSGVPICKRLFYGDITRGQHGATNFRALTVFLFSFFAYLPFFSKPLFCPLCAYCCNPEIDFISFALIVEEF